MKLSELKALGKDLSDKLDTFNQAFVEAQTKYPEKVGLEIKVMSLPQTINQKEHLRMLVLSMAVHPSDIEDDG